MLNKKKKWEKWKIKVGAGLFVKNVKGAEKKAGGFAKKCDSATRWH